MQLSLDLFGIVIFLIIVRQSKAGISKNGEIYDQNADDYGDKQIKTIRNSNSNFDYKNNDPLNSVNSDTNSNTDSEEYYQVEKRSYWIYVDRIDSYKKIDPLNYVNNDTVSNSDSEVYYENVKQSDIYKNNDPLNFVNDNTNSKSDSEKYFDVDKQINVYKINDPLNSVNSDDEFEDDDEDDNYSDYYLNSVNNDTNSDYDEFFFGDYKQSDVYKNNETLNSVNDDTNSNSHFEKYFDVDKQSDFGNNDFKNNNPVNLSLRKASAKICCPRKNMENSQCKDVREEEITRVKVNLNVKTILWEPIDFVKNVVYLREDEYSLTEDGVNIVNYTYTSYYCIFPYQFNSKFPKSIWIFLHFGPLTLMTATFEITIISMLCYILTIALYLYIRKLRNMLGKCLICTLLSIFLHSLIDILNHLNSLDDICSLKGYSHYFLGMSIYLWFTVMSFHMWKTFRSAFCEDPGYNFLAYSFFVWGTAGVSTGVIYLVNQVWENQVNAINWLPVVGFTKCYVENNRWSSWIYLHGPKLILSSFNLILFILTAVHIQKVKSELKRFKLRQVESPICLQFDIQTYLQFLRLSAIMGVFYIGSFGGFLSNDNMWYPVIKVTYYVHQSFGIFIFLLLVLKRSTLKMIINRSRKRN